VIDYDCAIRHDGQDLRNQTAHIVIIAHAQDNHLAAHCGLSGRIMDRADMVRAPCPSLVGGSVKNLHHMPSLGQVPRHGMTHNAQPDKAYLHATILQSA
jgi:hypothetical protein